MKAHGSQVLTDVFLIVDAPQQSVMMNQALVTQTIVVRGVNL